MASGSRGSRSHHSHDHHNSGSESDRDIGDGYDISHHPSRHSRIEELDSPARSLAGITGINQGGQAEETPGPSSSRRQRDQRARMHSSLIVIRLCVLLTLGSVKLT